MAKKLLYVFMIMFVGVAAAQVDPDETLGVITTFEDEEGLTWGSVECSGAQVFELTTNPTGGDQVGKVTTTECTSEGFVLEDELVPLDFSIRNWMMISVYAPAAGKTVAFKLMDAANPDNNMILEATTTKAANRDLLNMITQLL